MPAQLRDVVGFMPIAPADRTEMRRLRILCRFSNQPVAEIVQCGEPTPLDPMMMITLAEVEKNLSPPGPAQE
jgi:hypothetical protein